MLVPFATKLDEKTVDALDRLADKTQVPKSRLIAKAIDLLVEHYEQIDQDLAFARSSRPEGRGSSLVTARQEPQKQTVTA